MNRYIRKGNNFDMGVNPVVGLTVKVNGFISKGNNFDMGVNPVVGLTRKVNGNASKGNNFDMGIFAPFLFVGTPLGADSFFFSFFF